MSNNQIFVLIIIIASILLVTGTIMMHKGEVIVNLTLRSLMGIIGIYFVNYLLLKAQVDLNLGLNSISVLTVGVLGLPGFILILGVNIYYYI